MTMKEQQNEFQFEDHRSIKDAYDVNVSEDSNQPEVLPEQNSAGTMESVSSELKTLHNESRKQIRAFRKFLEEYASFSENITRSIEEIRDNERRINKIASKSRLSLLRNLLNVRDSFKRNLEQTKEKLNAMSPIKKFLMDESMLKSLIEGQELALIKLNDSLLDEEVREIDAEKKPFDPRLMRAVTSEETDKIPPGHVIKVLRTGYTIGDEILRFAEVSVSANPHDYNL